MYTGVGKSSFTAVMQVMITAIVLLTRMNSVSCIHNCKATFAYPCICIVYAYLFWLSTYPIYLQ